MSHPRSTFPEQVIADHAANGLAHTARAYGTHRATLRRWLVERGVQIRPHGLRIGRQPLTGDRREAQRRYDRAYYEAHREQRRAAFRRWYYAKRQAGAA